MVGRRVGLTSAAAGPAAPVIEALHRAGHHVVGVDTSSGADERVQWRITDPSAPEVLDALADLDVLVHLATPLLLEQSLGVEPQRRRYETVRTVQALTTAAAAAGLGHVVVVTSAMVYGASADNPIPLAETAPVAEADHDGLVADLTAVEEVVVAARRVHPGVRFTVLRPAALVGAGVDTIITRHFEAPRLLTVRGARPAWQFCHLADLGEAVVTAIRLGERSTADLPDVLAVGAPGWLDQSQVEELVRLRRVELSRAAAQGAADRLHRLGVLPLPASDLDFVTYPWVVEPAALTRAGWSAQYDNIAALQVLADQVRGHHAVLARRVARPDATALAAAAGAASAAVAAVATAALMRRRRRS